MLDRSTLFAKIQNKARRTVRRIPRGVVTPALPGNVYSGHRALFDFLAAFTVGRKVLYSGNATAYGARHLQERSNAAAVVAVTSNPQIREFAQKHFASPQVTYAARPDPASRFDIVVLTEHTAPAPVSLLDHLEDNGLLLFSYQPSLRNTGILDSARRRFRVVREFALVAPDGFDLGDPRASDVPPRSFEVVEVADFVPPRALTVIALATDDPKWDQVQLHAGCGPVTLPGWVNLDNQPYPGIDFLWDASRGIPISSARYIFAEHFIEHLTYAQAREFVALCRRVLRDDGVLRLSTPNLDWVWHVSYHPGAWADDTEAQRDCFILNRAFRGWGHQFLYNAETLTALLHNAGFADVRFFSHGESDNGDLRNLEHHETYPDTPDLPHVIVAEASGRRAIPAVPEGAELIAEYERDIATV